MSVYGHLVCASTREEFFLGTYLFENGFWRAGLDDTLLDFAILRFAFNHREHEIVALTETMMSADAYAFSEVDPDPAQLPSPGGNLLCLLCQVASNHALGRFLSQHLGHQLVFRAGPAAASKRA